MRVKKRIPDFCAISRRSIRRDFEYGKIYARGEKRREIANSPEINSERRIIFVGENSSYFKLRAFLLGRHVRLVEQSSVGGWVCEFVRDDDRQALNTAAGWSESKDRYLFDNVKFK